MWIDTHCHLNFKEFDNRLSSVLSQAEAHKVHQWISICCEVADFDDVYALTHLHPCLYASAGIHPHESKKDFDRYGLHALKERLKKQALLSKVVGLGETGLDYHYDHSPREIQKQVFEMHLDVACETHLPLIVHTREAEEETIAILKAYEGRVEGVIHCFSGTQWLAERALALGFYISLSGIVTFPKAQELRDSVKAIPLERILLETDAPFLAPVPHRGKTNEPSFLIHTAQVVAELKKISLEELSSHTSSNAHNLFKKMNTRDL